MTIKAITFDLDDTLWPVMPTLKRAEIETYQWLCDNAPAITEQYSLMDIAEYRLKLFKDNTDFKHQISKVRIATIRQLALSSGLAEPVATELAEQSFQIHYQLRQQVNCYDGAEELLEELSKNYLLGAISNGNADVYKTSIGQYFKFAVSAEQVNASKPDRIIFDLALSHIENALGESINAKQILHVGDDFHCDVIGAKQADFKAVWLDHQEGNKQTERKTASTLAEGIRADAIINSIQELPAALALCH